MKNKILFLDFDGVLNSVRSATAFGGYPWHVNEEALKLFDLVAISLIRKLCEECNVKIVVSSTWRLSYSCSQLAEWLDLPIIDKTPNTKFSGFRGADIQSYLDSNLDKVSKYAILDDDSDMLETQKNYFVQTDAKEGLSYRNYLKLTELLSDE